MIITRTPFRISFAGGGTDLKAYYSKEPGKVISTSIDKYIYVVIKRQLGVVEYKYRINWSKVEFKNTIDEIEHPIVREALRMFEIDFPIEITTFTDIPGQTGLGSSSAFAVGLVHALHALRGEMVTKGAIASTAAQIEVDILGRSMGKQDHYASAYGNLNIFTFNKNGSVNVEPVLYQPEVRSLIEKNLNLFYLKSKRNASKILEIQEQNTSKIFKNLTKLKSMVNPLAEIFSSGLDINKFGEMLHQSWLIKKGLTDVISSTEIDTYYQKALDNGALGGKLLGAGGGGFLLIYVEEQKQQAVVDALSNLYHLNVGFDQGGTRITYYDQ
jgi:D-glycero-alpha-D-manno-heptose-7-phosphate kinase